MSAISCDCSTDEGEICDAYSAKERKARKTHVCTECRSPIAKGQRYMEETGICEREPFRERTCLPCMAIRRRYCPHGFAFGFLRETIMDCLGFDYTEVPPEDEWEDIDEEDAARVAEERKDAR